MQAFSLIENPPYRILFSLEKQAAILNKVIMLNNAYSDPPFL